MTEPLSLKILVQWSQNIKMKRNLVKNNINMQQLQQAKSSMDLTSALKGISLELEAHPDLVGDNYLK